MFHALNSNYFVQRQGDRSTIDTLRQAQSEEMYQRLPNRHQTFVAAFPKGNGGVGMDTASSYDDEKERLAQAAGGQ